MRDIDWASKRLYPDTWQLAKIFNHHDPHVRRALFSWACKYVGLPDELEEPVRRYLFDAAVKEYKEGIASGRLKDDHGRRVLWNLKS